MPVVSAPKIEKIARAISAGTDPKTALLEAVGDLANFEVFDDLVLVATAIRPEKTAGGIIRPVSNQEEDEWQGKVGLVLKSGPNAASEHEPEEERGNKAQTNTWVVYAIKDGWPVQINGTACRFVPYSKIRARVSNPTMVF